MDGGHDAPLRWYPSAVARFSGGITDLLACYESRLRMMGSALVRDAETWHSCREHAETILAVCVRGIAERRVIKDGANWALASLIGTQRAALDIHPLESLRAGTVLVELVTRLAAAAVATDPDPVGLLTSVILTLNQAIASGVRLASTSYDRFLFEQIRQMQQDTHRAMARDIHDRVGNGVSLAYRQLELYDVLRTRDCETAYDKVREARRVLTATLDDTRRLVDDLRLDETPIPVSDAIRLFIRSAATESVTAADVTVDGDEEWIPHDVGSELFIVIREALRNTFKYADASRVMVRLHLSPWRVCVSVEDDGVGFDPDTANGGYGLVSMTERVRLLGGELRIVSKPGAGAKVMVAVPLLEEAHDRTG
jgi:signal transduction histidine kinase